MRMHNGPKSELNLLVFGCALERGCARLMACHCGANSRPLSGVSGTKSGTGLPATSITGKRMERVVQHCVSRIYPASCSVTASGPIRRPAAGSLFCFGSAAYRLRFPSSTDPP